jgi:hypothetical protein
VYNKESNVNQCASYEHGGGTPVEVMSLIENMTDQINSIYMGTAVNTGLLLVIVFYAFISGKKNDPNNR